VWWKGGGSALLDQVEQFLTGRATNAADEVIE
jgi:hypothetical protein